MRLVSDEPGVAGGQPLVSRLRAVIAAKDEQVSVLQAQLGAALTRLDAAAQVIDAVITRKVTEWLLPGRRSMVHCSHVRG